MYDHGVLKHTDTTSQGERDMGVGSSSFKRTQKHRNHLTQKQMLKTVRKKALLSSLYHKVSDTVMIFFEDDSVELSSTRSFSTAQLGLKASLLINSLQPTLFNEVHVNEVVGRRSKALQVKLDQSFAKSLLTNSGTPQEPTSRYQITSELHSTILSSTYLPPSFASVIISTVCRVAIAGRSSALLYGTDTYRRGSSTETRSRFDCFTLCNSGDDTRSDGFVYRFICSLLVKDEDTGEKKLYAVVRRMVPADNNSYFCPVRHKYVRDRFFKYTQYREESELQIVNLDKLFLRKVWIVPSFVSEGAYYEFECY